MNGKPAEHAEHELGASSLTSHARWCREVGAAWYFQGLGGRVRADGLPRHATHETHGVCVGGTQMHWSYKGRGGVSVHL